MRLVQRGSRGSRQRAYLNLQRKQETPVVVPEDSVDVRSFELEKLDLPTGWLVIDDGPEQATFIRHESWEVNNQRGITELIVSYTTRKEAAMMIRARGCSVNLKKGFGLERLLEDVPVENIFF